VIIGLLRKISQAVCVGFQRYAFIAIPPQHRGFAGARVELPLNRDPWCIPKIRKQSEAATQFLPFVDIHPSSDHFLGYNALIIS